MCFADRVPALWFFPAMDECWHVASDGVRLAVTVSGSGPSLLFLHGEGYGRHDWDAVRAFLKWTTPALR